MFSIERVLPFQRGFHKKIFVLRTFEEPSFFPPLHASSLMTQHTKQCLTLKGSLVVCLEEPFLFRTLQQVLLCQKGFQVEHFLEAKNLTY